MSDKGRQRTKDLKTRIARRRLEEYSYNSIEDYNFRQLRARGVIREEK